MIPIELAFVAKSMTFPLRNHCPKLGKLVFLAIWLIFSLRFDVSADDVRVAWGNGGSNSFIDPNRWTAFADPTPPGGTNKQLPGYEAGAPSNAIIQGGTATSTLYAGDYFQSAFYFSPLIVRGGASLTINGTLDMSNAGAFLAGQTNPGNVVTVGSTGTLIVGQGLAVGNASGGDNFNLNNGGTVEVIGNLTLNNPGLNNFNFGTSNDGLNVSLDVTGAVSIDNANNAPFVVGAGSTLNIGEASHTFADGLTVSGGTIGTGNSEAADPTITSGLLTLGAGSTIDYSINGEGTPDSDTWITSGGLSLNLLDSYNLVVDVVAGDVKQSAGPFVVFDNVGPITNFNAANWTISVTEGTRLASTGTLLINPSDNTQLILEGFEAFAIPEPSTAMLLVIASAAILLRRYRETMETRETPTAFFPRL